MQLYLLHHSNCQHLKYEYKWRRCLFTITNQDLDNSSPVTGLDAGLVERQAGTYQATEAGA